MSPFNFLLVLIAEICTIAGQVLFKHALTREDTSRALFVQLMGLGITLKAIEFFLGSACRRSSRSAISTPSMRSTGSRSSRRRGFF